MIQSRDLVGLRNAVKKSGAIDRAMEKAASLVGVAKSELQELPETPARNLLATLADGILERRY